MLDKIAPVGLSRGIYPERPEPRSEKLDELWGKVRRRLAPRHRRLSVGHKKIVDFVHAHGSSFEKAGHSDLAESARVLKHRLRKEGFNPALTGEVFALVRETARRELGMAHYDVQLIGGWVLLNGMVAEMETGEGKTLAATLPACALAMTGVPVHIVTVNDYLADRDARSMKPLYESLGLTVGAVVHDMTPEDRRRAYRCDITYCTNKEVVFDYLRDRIVLWDRPTALRLQMEKLYGSNSRLNRLVLRGLHFAIVDEADSVLIDEARTPLIISAEAEGAYDEKIYRHALALAVGLIPDRDYSLAPDEKKITIRQSGKFKIEASDWQSAGLEAGIEQKEDLVHQALFALRFLKPNIDYLVKDEKILIIDEYTGRIMADRSWERGLHQFVEIKEDCEVTNRKQTKAKISYQRFFRRYLGLAGMTGTAREVADEFDSIYRLKVVSIPTNRLVQRHRLPDRIFDREEEKWNAAVEVIGSCHREGRPVLIGTRSVEASERLSGCLENAELPHSVLNARQNEEEAQIIAEAGQAGRITVATNMAGRGTDIKLGRGVADLGGLHVIATEMHDAGRIDRQLFGRCGRQGDPGSVEVLLSLQDELIKAYAGRFRRGLIIFSKPILPPALWRYAAKRLFAVAQKRAEGLHARMRSELMKVDIQMGEFLAFTGRQE